MVEDEFPDEYPVETAVAEPVQGDSFKRLKTNEAKLWLLYETAKRHKLNSESPPEVPAEVVEGAMKQAFDHKEFRIAFGLAQAYGLLERVIDEIKKIPMGKPDWYSEHQIFGPSHRVDSPYKLKMALIEQVLHPAGRLEEVVALLLECDRKSDALRAAAQISPERAVQLTEQSQDIDMLESCLSIVRDHKREDLEAKLKSAHIDGLLKSSWHRAPETAARYGFSPAEVEGVRVSALERGLDGLEKDTIEPYNIKHTIDWSRSSISKLSLALKEKYQQRLLGILSGKGNTIEEMEVSAEFGLYDRSLSAAIRALGEVKDSSARQKVVDFVHRQLFEKINKEKAWEYVEHMLITLDRTYAYDIAKRFGFVDRLLDEYERLGKFESAGHIAYLESRFASNREDLRRRAKEFYIKAGSYSSAASFADNPDEKAQLFLSGAEHCLKNPVQNTLYSNVVSYLREAIAVAKKMPDLNKPMLVAAEAVKILVKNRNYAEAVLFARELGIEHTKVPRSALAGYERQSDFARCAVVASALGRKRDTQMYTSMAAFAGQKIPEKVDDFWAEER